MRKIHMTGLLFLISLSGYSQVSKCLHDHFQLYAENYRGTIAWQYSLNANDWTTLDGETGDTIQLVAENYAYYRIAITEGTCQPVYSENITVMVYNPPVVSLNFVDSVCLNEQAFFAEGGLPAGGTYSGEGIVDGKFIPAMVGVGLHEVNYYYTDTLSNCSNDASDQIRVLPLPDVADAGEDIVLNPFDSVQLQANTPAIGTGSWTIIEGDGGRLSDSNDPDAWFYRADDTLDYTLRWTINHRCGTSSDDVTLNFALLSINPCPDAPVMVDDDGNIYPTIQIGEQCWMGKNLNVGTMVVSNITTINHSDVSDNGVIEKYCWENDPDSCDAYGGLYDWNEAMAYSEEVGARGICPEGWHIPTKEEWQELDDFYKYGDAGLHLKVGGSSGFNGLLAGDRHAQGMFVSQNSSGFLWTSTKYTILNDNSAYYRELCACNDHLDYGHFSRFTGATVRCIKDRE